MIAWDVLEFFYFDEEIELSEWDIEHIDFDVENRELTCCDRINRLLKIILTFHIS